MRPASILNFQNKHYGACKLIPMTSDVKFKEIMKNRIVLQRSSMGDTADKTVSEARINKLFLELKSNQQKYGLGFYEIYADENFLGIAGYFCEKGKYGMYPELCCYLLPEHQKRGVATDLTAALIDYAFEASDCYKVIADAFPNNYSSLVLQKYGFIRRSERHQYMPSNTRQFGQIRYKLTRRDRGLYLLSEMIDKEKNNLQPNFLHLAKDNERTRKLWYSYARKGILLSNGGVKSSLITLNNLSNNQNMNSFNMYRSDRVGSTTITQDMINNFLVEDNAISSDTDLQKIATGFCLGSHEGFTRIARCLYDVKNNNGMFYPKCSYGLLATAVASMEPVGYKIHLIDVKREQGEKITTESLLKLIRLHPSAKTLFLELKTVAGAIYTPSELSEIINICKANGLFLIIDAAHFNMQYDKAHKFPDISGLCQKLNYHDFFIIHTCSKSYGLERARIGFYLCSTMNRIANIQTVIDRDLYRVLGSLGDLPFEVTRQLFLSSVKQRQEYRDNQNLVHRYNMNLMLAYIEGVASKSIDEDVKNQIQNEIPLQYQNGIPGLQIIYKPEGGIHMKINTSGLKNKYLANIRIFNSEILSYALHKLHKVVTLHSYLLLDPEGFSMRLSYSIREDVHKGMQAIHNFAISLSDMPSPNKFMPGIKLAEDLILLQGDENKTRNFRSREMTFFKYRENIRKKMPFHRFNEQALDEVMDEAATTIQNAWKYFKTSRPKINFGAKDHDVQEPASQANTVRAKL